MVVLRSSIFNILFLLWTLALGIIGVPIMMLGLAFALLQRKPTIIVRRVIMSHFGKLWTDFILLLARSICGLNVKINGLENLPPEAPFVLACKHESTWETLWLVSYFNCPTFILKKELQYIPIFGWYLWYAGMIAIDRKRGLNSLQQIRQQAQKVLQEEGRILVVFPEGTRVPHGRRTRLQPGIAAIYNSNQDIPIIPVAVDSGKLWPRRAFWMLFPGTINIHFNPAIPPNLAKDEFLHRLSDSINIQGLS
jgi:1-acyl-sn-glycerol-3-phosphate acyltransferase